MQNLDKQYLYSELTSKILEAYYKIFNNIGFGFEQQVYVKGMEIELQEIGVQNFIVNPQININYKGSVIGNFSVALSLEDKVMVEITNNEQLQSADLERLGRKLKQSSAEVGLLLNFGLIPEHKRKLKN